MIIHSQYVGVPMQYGAMMFTSAYHENPNYHVPLNLKDGEVYHVAVQLVDVNLEPTKLTSRTQIALLVEPINENGCVMGRYFCSQVCDLYENWNVKGSIKLNEFIKRKEEEEDEN